MIIFRLPFLVNDGKMMLIMLRTSRFFLILLLLGAAVAAGVMFTGIFTDFNDPIFQRALLRLLAVVGLASLLAMTVSLMARVEGEELAPTPAPSPRRSRRS
ncbi:MAG TPA: hypothetical protein VLA04_04745 [Verrucomicrobiae bacterium]|nr:hypothetical protein [Verrucomicrobiae bacterium]